MRCKSSFPNGAVYEFLLTNTKPMESYSIHELAYMAYGPCFKIGAAVKNRFQFLIKLIPCKQVSGVANFPTGPYIGMQVDVEMVETHSSNHSTKLKPRSNCQTARNRGQFRHIDCGQLTAEKATSPILIHSFIREISS